MSNTALYRPCTSDRAPVDEFGTFGYDRGADWKGARYHRGKDVPIPQGTALYGCGDGTVVSVSQVQRVGYIWIVVIDYPLVGGSTVRVSTQHHSRIDVRVGQVVNSRTRIGSSGGQPGTLGAGNSNGAHVHIETYVNGVLVNPDSVLNSRSLLASGGGSSGGEEDMTPEQDAMLRDIQNKLSIPGAGYGIPQVIMSDVRGIAAGGIKFPGAEYNAFAALGQQLQVLIDRTAGLSEDEKQQLGATIAQMVTAAVDVPTAAETAQAVRDELIKPDA